MKHIFRPSAEKQFIKLDRLTQTKITQKLEYFLSSSNPLLFAKRLTDRETGQYRFRIGDYRVIFDVEEEKIIILTVGHRREIYK